jgi:hypothetical protein
MPQLTDRPIQFDSEVRACEFLQNFGIHLQDYMESQLRRLWSEYTLTNSMEPSPSGEAAICSTTHFLEPEASLLWSPEPANGPYPMPHESNPYHPILFL